MRRGALSALLLLGLGLLTWPGVLRGGTLLPLDWPYECCHPWRDLRPGTVAANPRQNDAFSQLLPLDLYTRERLRQLEAPLWNPWLGGGIPHLATGFTRAVYPPVWPTLPLSVTAARNVEVLGHLVLGGVLQLLWLRRLGCGWTAGLLGGAAFAFSGALAVRLPLGYVLETLVWLPGLLWALEGILRGGRATVAWLAVVASLQLLAGSLPDVLSSWIFCLVYLLGRLGAGAAGGRRAGVLGRVAAGVGLAALLSGAQLLPHLELAARSQRGARSVEELRGGSVPASALLTLLSPAVYGTDSGRDYRFPVPSAGAQAYVGVVALAGLLFGLRGRAARRAIPVGLATLAVWLIAAGSPLLDLLCAAFPPVRGLRYVYTFSNVCAAGIAALGAIGIERLLRHPGPARRSRTLALALAGAAALAAGLGRAAEAPLGGSLLQAALGLAGLAAVAALVAGRDAGWLSRRGLGVALLLLAAVDLSRYSASENPVLSPAVYPPWPPAPGLEAIAADPAQPRALSVLGEQPPWGPGPNTLMGWRVADAGAYHSLLPARLVRYFTVMGRLSEGASPAAALAGGRDLFNNLEAYAFRPGVLPRLMRIGYVVLPPDARPTTRERLVRAHRGELRVFRYLDPLPRAFVTPGHVVVSDPEAALARLLEPDFDPEQTAVLETAAGAPSLGAAAGASAVRVLEDRPERLALEVEGPGGILVVTDAMDPGWRARVDGAEVPLLRADYLFRGVALGAGRHVVEMRYAPRSWRAGLLASAAGLLLVGALFLRGARRGGVVASGSPSGPEGERGA